MHMFNTLRWRHLFDHRGLDVVCLLNTSQRAVVMLLKALHIRDNSAHVGSQHGQRSGARVLVVVRGLDFNLDSDGC